MENIIMDSVAQGASGVKFMEQNKIDSLIMTWTSKVPQEQLPMIIERLKKTPEDKYPFLLGMELKDPTIITVVSVFAGSLGIDRFMLGDVGLGVAKLLTAGFCGIGWIVDLFLVSKRAKELNFAEIMKRLS